MVVKDMKPAWTVWNGITHSRCVMRLVLLAVTLQLQHAANFGSCQKTVEFSSVVLFFFFCFVPAGCDSDRLERSREDIRQSCRPSTTSHHPACQPYCHSHTGWKGWVRVKNGRMDDLWQQCHSCCSVFDTNCHSPSSTLVLSVCVYFPSFLLLGVV